ncbi:MAG: YtxH domain-containing protein [Nitrosospira sp.]|nr:YtxH domain-containing protein [Nitrosospira sp.]
MNQDSTDVSHLTCLLWGVAVGALAMFLLDPEKGNRRRALARDKMYSAMIRTGKRVDAKSRDLANRAKGLRAEVRHVLP